MTTPVAAAPPDPAAPLAHVAAIPPYPPGRPIDAVAREFGLNPFTIVKLASNENPRGCSLAVQQALQSFAPHLYPDFDCYELRHAIARQERLAPAQVLPAAGSSEIILLAARAYLDASRAALIPQYAFQSYEGAVKSVGAEAIFVPARNWAPDLDALLAAVTERVRLVYLATPNNPTGVGIAPDQLEQFVASLPAHVLLVLDEAYREYLDPAMRPDVLRLLSRRPQLVVMRTFSKIHGLAGLRVGYGLGDAAILDLLRRLQLPFSVSSIGQHAALAALADADFAEQSRQTNASERDRMASAFAARDVEFVPSSGNFILTNVGDGNATARELMRRGVIVRPVGNYGLPAWLRVSVGLPHENDRFFACLDELRGAAAMKS